MFINCNLKIQPHNFLTNTAINYRPQSCDDNFKYQNEISGIYYCPLFTGKEKIPEAEREEWFNSLIPEDLVDYTFRIKHGVSLHLKNYILDCDISEAQKKMEHQLEIMKKYPDKFINNVDDDIDIRKDYYYPLLVLCDIYDKESIDVLFRKRLANAEEFLDRLRDWSYEDLKLLKAAIELQNPSGKPLMAQQKLDICQIIDNYTFNLYPLDNIRNMISEGKIDLAKLKTDLLEDIFKEIGYSETDIKEVAPEKFLTWNTDYIHVLNNTLSSLDYTKSSPLIDLLAFANSKTNFIDIIHNTDNVYGKANKKTREMFEKLNMDYDIWVNPPENFKMDICANDANMDRITQISEKLMENVEFLRNTPAKSFIDKQYPKYIKNNKFIIPEEIINNKNKLYNFTDSLIMQLHGVWKHAEGNLDNPQKQFAAQKTLSIRDEFTHILKDISDINTNIIPQNLNLTIKLWDRVPQKDLFQGHYSTCCLALDHAAGMSVPIFLMNTAFNMIELVDKDSGNTIGNALCYFALDNSNQPCFIIDDIEIRHNDTPAEDVGRKVRKAMTDFAYELTRKITGQNNTKIYLGAAYNDVPDDDLENVEKHIKLIGDYAPENKKIYLDAYYGNIGHENLEIDNAKLYLLK